MDLFNLEELQMSTVDRLQRQPSIVDEALEISDPTPNIRDLFVQFNEDYFWGALASVEVRWSPRMTLCAGICHYENRAGYCSIRLSQPLLKYRPRRNIVETLLHEMIHAYLFVTHNNRDHDAHGPEFLKHMKRINDQTGTKITVCHNFFDEVDIHRQHWWKCNGPCQHRRPYYGVVKRSMNRAPSPRDLWWNEHKVTCGGTFAKIKEPANYKKKTTKKHNDKDGIGNSSLFAPSTSSEIIARSPIQQSFNSMNNLPKISNTSAPLNSVSSKLIDGHAGSSFIPFSGKGNVLGSKNSQETPAKSFVRKQPGEVTGNKNTKNAANYSAVEDDTNTSKAKPLVPVKQTTLDSFFKTTPPKNKITSDTLSTNNSSDDIVILSESIGERGIYDNSRKNVKCPVCGNYVNREDINGHLDMCLQM